jgi:hypothetical protein
VPAIAWKSLPNLVLKLPAILRLRLLNLQADLFLADDKHLFRPGTRGDRDAKPYNGGPQDEA